MPVRRSTSLTRRKFFASTAAAVPLALGVSSRAWPAGEKREVSWLGEVQTPPAKLPEGAPKLSPILVDDGGRPITTLDAWKRRREQILAAWRSFLRPLEVTRPSSKFTVLEEDHPEGCVRQLVRYESEPGLPVEGYLIKPAGKSGPLPGVVALHSTVNHTIRQPAGVEGKPEKFFGLKLAQRGVVTFSPRCFLWQGEGGYLELVRKFKQRRPKSLGMAKMLWDAQRGLDVLGDLPSVDRQRLGCVGHSLGAKEALYLAAFDERVKVAVSSEGGIGTTFSNWHDPWYLGPDVKNGKFTREHHELLALIAPRPFLLLGGDSADGVRSWPFIEAALPVYELYGRPARLGLFDHHQGHAVPPEAEKRIYEWFDAYL